jgi:tetratricopeptide (TPR) repeat protein
VSRNVVMLALALSFGAAATAPASEKPAPPAVQEVAAPHDGRREEAALLSGRGLVLLHAERYADALALFTQAAAIDPDDAYILYYKGVTEGRLEQWPAAVADLRAAMAKRPDLSQGALELGVALLHEGQPAEAAVWLAQAQQVPDLDAAASFYLGIAQLRTGELEAARQNLERAAARDPQYTVASRYYQGVVEVRLGNQDRAIEHFQYVAATSPESAIGREASDFLSAVQMGAQPTLRRYQVYGGTGLEYDSNVVLAPLDGELAVGFGDQADGRAIFLAGGRPDLAQGDGAGRRRLRLFSESVFRSDRVQHAGPPPEPGRDRRGRAVRRRPAGGLRLLSARRRELHAAGGGAAVGTGE